MSCHHKDLICASFLQGLCCSKKAVHVINDVILSNQRQSKRHINTCKDRPDKQEERRARAPTTVSTEWWHVPAPAPHSPPRLLTQVTSHTAPATCQKAPGTLKALGGREVCGTTLKYTGKLFFWMLSTLSNGTTYFKGFPKHFLILSYSLYGKT